MTRAPEAAGEVLEAIARARIVPVLAIADAATARPLGRVLKAGGLRCAEVTLRTDAAEPSPRALAEDPEMLVGAGTVLTTDQVERAARAGARYIVSPGLDVRVVRHCRRLGTAVLPRVATATELQAAMREGIDVVKLFPAEPLEGVSLPRALAAAFPTARFAPTGGIAPAKLPADLAEPAVLGVGSSFMAEDVPERNNRVVVDRDGGIRVHWTPNNLQPHRELVRRTTHVVRRAGYPLVLTERMDIATNSHMCGTAVMGHDPASSVLDPGCRSHAVRNLWIVDSSCFPPSAALNPALTIAANALRVAARREILQ